MDGAVITCTHSALKAVPYIQALLDDEFICYVGVELCTAHGDLVFIPEVADEQFFNEDWAPQGPQIDLDNEQELWHFEALQEKLTHFRGVQIAVHPYTRLNSRAWGDRAFTLSAVNAVETRIGRGMAQRDYLCDQILVREQTYIMKNPSWNGSKIFPTGRGRNNPQRVWIVIVSAPDSYRR